MFQLMIPQTAPNGRKLRCDIVADVAAGLSYRTKKSRLPKDMCPPTGFDSVVGQVRGHHQKMLMRAKNTMEGKILVCSPRDEGRSTCNSIRALTKECGTAHLRWDGKERR